MTLIGYDWNEAGNWTCEKETFCRRGIPKPGSEISESQLAEFLGNRKFKSVY